VTKTEVHVFIGPHCIMLATASEWPACPARPSAVSRSVCACIRSRNRNSFDFYCPR